MIEGIDKLKTHL